MTYTTDEKGNTVWHFQTGIKGIELFKELGMENTISSEHLEEHLASHNRRVEKEEKLFFDYFFKLFNLKS